MDAVNFTRTNDANCFTGAIIGAVRHQYSADISEFMIFAHGCGFELKAGSDQHGFPELIFDAITSTEMSIHKFGGELHRRRFSRDVNGLARLRHHVRDVGPMTVWVNSRHFTYSSVYTPDVDYIHAIALLDFDDHLQAYRIFDPLIIDKYPVSCFAFLPEDVLYEALCDDTTFREYAPPVGSLFYVTADNGLRAPDTLRTEILRQAETIHATPELWNCIEAFRVDCRGKYHLVDPFGERAGKRLFDHIRTYFVLPSLTRLADALALAAFAPDTLRLVADLQDKWAEIALLAIRFEKTIDDRVVEKIDAALADVDLRTKNLWQTILESGPRTVTDDV